MSPIGKKGKDTAAWRKNNVKKEDRGCKGKLKADYRAASLPLLLLLVVRTIWMSVLTSNVLLGEPKINQSALATARKSLALQT